MWICPQKKRPRPSRQNRAEVRQKRQRFRTWMTRVDPKQLVFVDESGANTKMGRTHAWRLRGQHRVDSLPINWGKNLPMIGAIRLCGLVLLRTNFASANGKRFVQWFRTLVRKHHPGDIVVMDNAKAHHDTRVRQILLKHQVTLIDQLPYSPDFTPIEPFGTSLLPNASVGSNMRGIKFHSTDQWD